MDEKFKRLSNYLDLDENAIIHEDDDAIVFKDPESGAYVTYDKRDGGFDHGSTNIDARLGALDKVYGNHKNIFDSINRNDLTNEELREALENQVGYWSSGFPQNAQLANIPDKTREKYWGKDAQLLRNYKLWNKNRPEKVFNMSDEQIAKLGQDPYYSNYKMSKVPLESLVNKQETYNRPEQWGPDARKFAYDPAKDKNTMYATKKANGSYMVGDGRHRLKALQNGGYTHANIPVLDEKEEMERLNLIDNK